STGGYRLRGSRTLGVSSVAISLAAVAYMTWVFCDPHPNWPRGESGLIALSTAALWGVALLAAGLIVGVAGIFKKSQRRWAAIGLAVNLVAIVVVVLLVMLT
ncbi:MAG TPA: hypothetical protein VEZ11_06440, partial [Thermoanaerobaculia bacterium]|nr:hypothetical protein [Thermoanaerobaculia bacterium]